MANQVSNGLSRQPVTTVPTPDPTSRTLEQLAAGIAALKELLLSELGSSGKAVASLREIIEARLDGSDKAIELLQVSTDKLPTKINETVARLQELHNEKFVSIALQFTERDTRTEQTAAQGKAALDAALAAQKEAVSEQNKSNALAINKSELGFTKQIDSITLLIASTAKGVDDKIDDIKGRLTTIEGQKTGGQMTTAAIVTMVSVIGTLIAIVIGVIAIISKTGA